MHGDTSGGGRDATISRSKFDAAVFDLDGVVTRTAGIHAAAWKRTFDEYFERVSGGEGYVPFSIEKEHRKYVDGKPRCDGVKSLLDSRGIELPHGHPSDPPEKETVCGLGNRKNDVFLEILKEEGAEVYQSSVDLIESLRRRGFRTAVASSSKNCDVVLDAANIAHLFEAKVDGIDLESLDIPGKPAPDMFLEAARRIGAEPERTVTFEDAAAGIQACRSGGFGLVVGVNRAGQADALLEAGADLVVDDLAEIDVKAGIGDLDNALASFEEIVLEMKGRQPAVFLDYDGTLTPIVSRPEDAVLSDAARTAVARLRELCSVAVISGRNLADVRERVGIPQLYYAGSHGFEISGPGGVEKRLAEAAGFLPALDGVQRELEVRLSGIEGAQVERKTYSVATHYRNVEDGKVAEVERIHAEVASVFGELRRSEGKKVLELQPDVDWDKGRAVEWLMDALHMRRPAVVPFYIGDDVTDEDAFEALKSVGITIVVGEGNPGESRGGTDAGNPGAGSSGSGGGGHGDSRPGTATRETRAQYALADTAEVVEFIDRLTAALERESAWWLTYHDFIPDHEGLREALCTLGNGYFATRGAAPESRADGTHYPGTYLAGGYNRLETVIAGRAVENEDLVNMPNWLCLQVRVPLGEWLDVSDSEVLHHGQELDIHGGVLHRTVVFRDGEGRQTRLTQRRIVSMSDMHLAALEVSIQPLNWSGTLEVRSAIDGTVSNSGVPRYAELSSRHLEPVRAAALSEDTVLLETRTSQSHLHVAVAARLLAFMDGERITSERLYAEEPGYVAQHLFLEVSRGEAIKLEKTVALYTSRDTAISECSLQAGQSVVRADRFEGMLHSHCLAWKFLWRRFGANLRLRNPREQRHAQRVLNLYSFHLLQTASMHSMDIDVGMPARGWHGEAYRGHIFWDELIIFPLLNYRTPQITRTLLMYRYRRLEEARHAARSLGYKGAMYPWQSGSDGREETQVLHLNPESGNWVPDKSHLQRHVNAAIVYNIWQYYQVSGDLQFLTWYGAEMILEITRFWASLATFDRETGRYGILGVMGPDEYHDAYPGVDRPGLDNNSYTNVMVAFVMNRALELFDLIPAPDLAELRERLSIQDAEVERWRDISRRMRVVFHDDGIISQFEGYERLEEFDWDGYRKKYGNIQRLDRILEAEGDSTNAYKLSKQSDVLMLFYLFSAEQLVELFEQMGYDFDPASIPANVSYYLKRTASGSSLSWITHSWVAARTDRSHSWRLFNTALLTDIADIQGGTTREGVHLGAMAGCVDLVQRGYTGIESRGDVLRFNPEFPEEVDGITMHVRYRDHWLEVDIDSERLSLRSLSGGAGPIRIQAWESVFDLAEGESVIVSSGCARR